MLPKPKLAPGERRNTEHGRELIEAAARHVLAHGLGDLSLRAVAAGIGTSHRMLIYYFHSADEFWETLLREIRHFEQAGRGTMWSDAPDTTTDIMRTWERFSSDAYLPIIQLMFEIFARAIRDRAKYKGFLDDVVDSWIKPIQQRHEAAGLASDVARVRAHLHLAIFRGLLLELLTTGNRKDTTAAMQYFARIVNAPEGP